MSSIAVLIPTYKPKEYFERCLKSLEQQTLSKNKFCVYIALNGPRDFYEEYIKTSLRNFTFQYKYFYLEKASVSNARNRLMEFSTEPFIAFIDDDDLISNNYLQSLLYVSSNVNMGVTNINNFIINIDEKKPANVTRQYVKNNIEERVNMKTRKFFSNPYGKMLHRSMVHDVFFDVNLKIGEDSLFMAKASKNIEKVVKSGDDVFYYANIRQGSASRSHINKIDLINRTFYLFKSYLRLFFNPCYNKIFILSRLIATLIHLKRVF